MNDKYYSYKSDNYSCSHCGWSGLGSKAAQGDFFDYGFELNCPKCHERFSGLISYPTFDETIEKGSAADKIVATAVKSLRERWLASMLKDVSQLPDLHYDFMAFVLREVKEDGEDFIVITHNNRLIWKELLVYEYAYRFIDIGRIFKNKYGAKMIDLVPDVDGDFLYGDKMASPRWVEEFRKELRSNKS